MGDKVQQPDSDEPKQKTATGYEIPVPTRDQVLGFFKKVAKPKKG
jgi:hypothetical protein